MTEWIAVLRWAHIIGATVLLGTGAGIAFFMVMAHRTGKPALIAHVSGTVVIADAVFTSTAVVSQPITGFLLAKAIGWDLTEGWIVLSLLLYALTGAFWLPVVWIQLRLRNLATCATEQGSDLSPEYYRLYRIWFAAGFPAFISVLAILWLMTSRPDLGRW